ncbi:MAG: DUF4412 domain-containing protein [Candidatus Kapaibacterium sp.]
MKKLTGFFIAFSFVLTIPVAKVWAQAGTFEGTVTWSMSIPRMDDQPHTVTTNLKGGKVEQEMDMGKQGLIKTYVIPEKNAKKYYMVMEAMKRGMSVEVPDNAVEASDTDLTATGKKETIAGHPSEEYLVKTPTGTLSLWASSDFPKNLTECIANSLRDQPRQDNNSSKAFLELAKKGLIPVKIVATSGGQTAMSMEFVKFEKKRLKDALFVPPTDIKYQPMPSMGGGGGMN